MGFHCTHLGSSLGELVIMGGEKDRLELLFKAHWMPGLFTYVLIFNPPNIAIRYVALFSFYRLGN